MRSNPSITAPWSLKLATIAVLLFLHGPFAIVMLYAFTTDEAAFTFPPPGLTLKWFGVAWNRTDLWQALTLSAARAPATTPGTRVYPDGDSGAAGAGAGGVRAPARCPMVNVGATSRNVASSSTTRAASTTPRSTRDTHLG